MFVAPAVNVGLNGNGFAHGLPFGPEMILNVEPESTGSSPDHGAIEALVVYDPHNEGVPSGARSPPKKCSSNISNGSCGVFLNVETNWPVTRSGLTSPASFTSEPEIGSSATTYSATSEPNGFASWVAT